MSENVLNLEKEKLLKITQQAIVQRLDEISEYLGPNFKVTFVGTNQLSNNGHIVITDEPDKSVLVGAIDNLVDEKHLVDEPKESL